MSLLPIARFLYEGNVQALEQAKFLIHKNKQGYEADDFFVILIIELLILKGGHLWHLILKG